MRTSSLSLLLATNCILSTHAFSGISSSPFVQSRNFSPKTTFSQKNDQKQKTATTSISMIDGLDDISTFASTSGMMLADLTMDKMKEGTKSFLIVLFAGGGLIPAAIGANKSMMGTLTGAKKDPNAGNPETSLDPTLAVTKTYISYSGATGPNLPNSALIFASEDIPVADIVAITGRLSNVDDAADWRNLPSTKLDNLSNPEKPPMWLPRATFKSNIRKAKFQSWPVDANTGLPIGGEELKKAEEGRIRKNGAEIGDAALDAVFDTWAWGAGIATPEKVVDQLNDWRVGGTLDLGKLTNAAIRGRATTGFAAFSFVMIQVIAYGTLFIAPALRFYFDIDVGFGQLGSCSENGCHPLF